jgi:inner membrane protein
LDNVTHAIAGAVTAEALNHVRRRFRGDANAPAPVFEGAAWAVSMLAHNLPDADALYTRITGGVLGYLLHHRGHTHTLALAPFVALLAYALVLGWLRVRRQALARGDRAWLAVLALLGPIGHISLDASNEYGVHPFWPLDDGWRYGDTIFIVEPLFWACALPILFVATRSTIGRWVWAGLLVLGVGLTWGVDLVPWSSAVATTLLAAIAIAVALRGSSLARVTFALVGCLAIFALFAIGSAVVSSSVRASLARARPDWETLDVSRSPIPATPLCWQAVAVQRSRDGLRYALRAAEVSAWPSLISAATCARAPHATTAPLVPGDVREPSVVVTGSFETPLAELRERAQRCDVHAYLRWSRAPFFAPMPGGDGDFVVGDLRYDRSPELEFAELRLPRTVEQCPRFVPPWRPPRTDVLGPQDAEMRR